MGEKKQPKLLAILIHLIVMVCYVNDKAFSDSYYVSKYYYFLLFALPLLGIWAYAELKRKRAKLFCINYLDIAVVLYFVYNLSSSYFTKSVVFPHPGIITHLILIVAYFIIKNAIHSYSEVEKTTFYKFLVGGLVLILLTNSLWGLAQYLGISEPSASFFKVGGAFGNPGPFSIFLVYIVPAALLIVFNKQNYSANLFKLALVALIVTVIVLPLTMGRTAWISFIVVVFYFLFNKFEVTQQVRSYLKTKWVVLSSIVIVGMLAILFVGYIWHLKSDSANGRLLIWNISSKVIAENPLLGSGYDSFATSFNDSQAAYFENIQNQNNNWLQIADNATFAFNEFIQITVELGVLGLLLFCAILFFAIKYHKEVDEQIRVLVYGVLLVLLIGSMFSYPMQTIPMQTLFYIVLAIIGGNIKKDNGYEFSLQKTPNTAIVMIILLIIGGSYVKGMQRYAAEKEWSKLQLVNRSIPSDAMASRYQKLVPVMQYNKYFMYNYGAELVYAQRYKKGIHILEQTLPRLNDSNLYIYLGLAYFELGNYSKAEECFEHASNIVPTKIFPLYNLVKVYRKTQRDKEALSLAKRIVSEGEKVQTSVGDKVILEMKKYIAESTLK